MSVADLLMAQRLAKRLSGLHERIAAEAMPGVDCVWCRTCGRSEPVNAAHCLAHGWPKCCGATMGTDKPASAPAAAQGGGE